MTATEPAASSPSLTATGIHIHGVWLVESHYVDEGFQHALAGRGLPDATAEPGVALSPAIDVWLLPAAVPDDASMEASAPAAATPAQAFVRLAVTVSPHAQPTFRASATYVALFTADPTPNLPLQDFAWSNGIAYLVPFIRQRLLAMTGEGRYPGYLLPPISVESLLEMVGRAAADASAAGSTGAGTAAGPPEIGGAALPTEVPGSPAGSALAVRAAGESDAGPRTRGRR